MVVRDRVVSWETSAYSTEGGLLSKTITSGVRNIGAEATAVKAKA